MPRSHRERTAEGERYSDGKGTYSGSPLNSSLNVVAGAITSKVSSTQQRAMIDAGPGCGQLPQPGAEITLEKLLNKIKHRHHQSGNFRIEAGRHIFVINVDRPDKTPDSIVEFDVEGFCARCAEAAKHL